MNVTLCVRCAMDDTVSNNFKVKNDFSHCLGSLSSLSSAAVSVMSQIVDDKKEKIPSTDVEKWLGKGAQVRCLIRCTGVWFAGGKFGTTWRAEQVKINPPKGLAGYSFVDDSDDEEGGGDDEEEVLDDSDLDGET